MEKIAIPTKERCLCAHFGRCDEFAMFEIQDNRFISESFITPPPHQPGVLPGWLAEQGVTHVIAGGIGHKAMNLLKQFNITSQVGAPNKSASELINDYLSNNLLISQNACDH
jgi:predicted Fe-Mo cluster-binding NifX family protein